MKMSEPDPMATTPLFTYLNPRCYLRPPEGTWWCGCLQTRSHLNLPSDGNPLDCSGVVGVGVGNYQIKKLLLLLLLLLLKMTKSNKTLRLEEESLGCLVERDGYIAIAAQVGSIQHL